MNRRNFLKTSSVALATSLANPSSEIFASSLSKLPAFPFVRIKYTSGNWKADPELAFIFYDFLQEFCSLKTEKKEFLMTLDTKEIQAMPFLFITGNHNFILKDKERENLMEYTHSGGLIFVDDCNHDVNGAFAKSFETEINRIFTEKQVLKKLNTKSPVFNSFFKFSKSPPTTQEINGWGDKQIHNYIKGITINNKTALIYSNKDYGCEWTDPNLTKSTKTKSATFGVNIAVLAMLQKFKKYKAIG